MFVNKRDWRSFLEQRSLQYKMASLSYRGHWGTNRTIPSIFYVCLGFGLRRLLKAINQNLDLDRCSLIPLTRFVWLGKSSKFGDEGELKVDNAKSGAVPLVSIPAFKSKADRREHDTHILVYAPPLGPPPQARHHHPIH